MGVEAPGFAKKGAIGRGILQVPGDEGGVHFGGPIDDDALGRDGRDAEVVQAPQQAVFAPGQTLR